MSIFDSVMGVIQPFSTAVSAITAVTGMGKPKSADFSVDSASSMMRSISAGQMSNPYSLDFKASKSKPAEQVDAEAINQAWLRRLQRYTEISGK